MRSQSAARALEETPRLAATGGRKPSPPAPDPVIEQLVAEAEYHRNRFELYRARVISASARATTPARLRELERTATAAEQRLAHARKAARGDD
jgi:hypothetical protein